MSDEQDDNKDALNERERLLKGTKPPTNKEDFMETVKRLVESVGGTVLEMREENPKSEVQVRMEFLGLVSRLISSNRRWAKEEQDFTLFMAAYDDGLLSDEDAKAYCEMQTTVGVALMQMSTILVNAASNLNSRTERVEDFPTEIILDDEEFKH